MMVLSRQWRAARPRRRTAAARPRRRTAAIRTSHAARPPRRTYPDSFFADPALVEDDARRMTQRGTSARPV
jgi:hypothetical protein